MNIEDSKELFRELFDEAADGILVGIGNGEIVEANQSIVNLTGYLKEELIGNNIKILFKNDELDQKPLRYDLVKKGDSVIRERIIVRKDGKEIPIEMNTKILKNGQMQAVFRDLTVRKETERKLLRSKNLLYKTEKTAKLGRYYYHFKENIWESSDVLDDIFGIDKDYERNFESWLDIVDDDFRTEMKAYFRVNIVKNKQAFDKEYKIKRINDKTSRWVHGYGDTEFDNKGNLVRLFGTIQDITERKEAELALIDNEKKYRSIFDNSPIGIFHYNKEGIITDCNLNFVKIIGSSKEKLIGLKMLKDLPNKQIVECVKDSLKKGEAYYKNWYQSVTGNKNTYVRILFQGIKNENKIITSGVGLVENITERYLSEKALRESEEKLKNIFKHSSNLFYSHDINHVITYLSPQVKNILGYEPDEAMVKWTELATDNPVNEKGYELTLKAIESGKIQVPYELELIHKSGHKVYVEVHEAPIVNDGKTIAIVGALHDITERKKAEEIIRLNEEKFRTIYNNSNDTIIVMNDKNEIISVNQAVTKIINYSTEEILGKNILDIIAEEYREEIQKRIFQLHKGEKIPLKEFEMITKTGYKVPVEGNSKQINYEGKKSILSVIRNIQERKELEHRIFEVMIETEEKERQRLASDIHDEIGPVLSSLKLYIESLDSTKDENKQQFIKGKLNELIKETITNVREVSNDLSPNVLNKYGLAKAIDSFFNNKKDLIAVNYTTNLKEERFSIIVETVYYRILKELFNNTIKHANASKIRTELKLINNELVLSYKDNGMGFNMQDANELNNNSLGLTNIENRIKTIKGKYSIETNLNKGFYFKLITEVKTKIIGV